ncbi:hypothetical protein [Ureibacillus xyleni]|uniref:hypothetical protein n=1 Tax=Ureibacillus xyleni TaxID=614648 RepID=UPI000BE42248|nr:hypothetical protein [Ureibacillus xyleni]
MQTGLILDTIEQSKLARLQKNKLYELFISEYASIHHEAVPNVFSLLPKLVLEEKLLYKILYIYLSYMHFIHVESNQYQNGAIK